MSMKQTIILGIESSCDETAAALVSDRREILAHQIMSSAHQHQLYGGVVPEMAARQHLDSIDLVIPATLKQAGLTLADIDGIAATAGPGLIGGLLVGTMAAKAIASARQIPYFAINHLEGHALTIRLTDGLAYPYVLLLVSGGHTQLLIVHNFGHYERLGTTMDDAAGEAFDKAAAIMGLGYPGGPAIERAAISGDPHAIDLPRPRHRNADCHFSFSGLKTAFMQKWREEVKTAGAHARKADFAASLQRAIAEGLTMRVARALDIFAQMYDKHQLVIAGGVAANRVIGQRLRALAREKGFILTIPPAELCTDNAAMIAWAGHEHYQAGQVSSLNLAPHPRWPLDPNAPPPPGRGVRK